MLRYCISDVFLLSRDRDLPFLILDLGLYVIDGVRGFDLKGDGLSSKRLYKDLHTVLKS